MATQSLYRRYRPRRFSELRGQEHVVRALRDSVANDRVGQAYLFSGPRGTGKTTTARIMAKALNCENVQDGEPCCECDSCLAVENGTSYDVHELDAASNNGVDAIRDLIEKASLGTPGRHKVYILDEVHMLSKGAEAALLKTLEEPPPHVVFVLATTDPQKMSDTIRSRTQHLQFHLLPADELSDHVRWVASDAGLELDDEAFAAALERGGGSARDTLSALELLASGGGSVGDATDVDTVMRALIDNDPAAALGAVAAGVAQGLDPRSMTEDIVRLLRNGFLTLMSPDLVALAPDRVAALTESARELGAAGLVRAIERLGSVLTDMRNAPDPRILLEVALVQLTSAEADGDVAALSRRLQRLEQQLESVSAAGPTPTASRAIDGATRSPSTATPAATSTAATTDTAPDPATAEVADSAPRDPETGRKVLGGAAQRAREAAERASGATAAAPKPQDVASPAPADAEPSPGSSQESTAHADSTAGGGIADSWPSVRSSLKPLVRALYSAGEMTESAPGAAVFQVHTPAQAAKCEEYKSTVEAALSAAVGGQVTLEIRSGSQPTEPGPSTGSDSPGSNTATDAGQDRSRSARSDRAAPDATQPQPADPDAAESSSAAPRAAHPKTGDLKTGEPDAAVPAAGNPETASARSGDSKSVTSAAAIPLQTDDAQTPADDAADAAGTEYPEPIEFQHEDEIDLNELVDAPPDSYRTPLDHLQEAFPGSRMMTDDER